MTKATGPNDRCPCGSGKKFKKCCQAETEGTDPVFRRVQRLHDELIPQILPFALEAFGPEILEDAWSDFYFGVPDEPFDPASPMNMLFMPWFFFNWTFDVPSDEIGTSVETNLVEEFISNFRLSSEQQSWLLSSVGQPFSFSEIVEVKPGIGIKIFDLLRQTEFELIERAGSKIMRRGEIIFNAVTHHEGISSNMGTGPLALPATHKQYVLAIRKRIVAESGSEEITGATLREFAEDLREYYLEFVDSVLEPPILVNSDGDPLVPQSVHYQVESADRAFLALKKLAAGMSVKELLADATVVDGLVTFAEFPWLGGTDQARKQRGGPIVLGNVKIDGTKLSVDVNSYERGRRVRELIERRLGDEAKYIATVVDESESQLNEQSEASGGPAPGGAEKHVVVSRSSDISDLPPEMRAVIEKSIRRHWTAWYDVSVPALNEMTPREAAQTPEGRELLESLLLYIEAEIDRSENDLLNPDMAELRRELGMEI